MSITDKKFDEILEKKTDQFKNAINSIDFNPITVQAIFNITNEIVEHLIKNNVFEGDDYNRFVALHEILEDACKIHKRIIKKTSTIKEEIHKLTPSEIKSIREQFQNGDTAVININGSKQLLTTDNLFVDKTQIEKFEKSDDFKKVKEHKEIENANDKS